MSVELFKVKKYPKTGGILKIFASNNLTYSLGKPLKTVEKVMEKFSTFLKVTT